MQTKSKSWPTSGAIELLPEIYLQLHGASWPPARDGVPVGFAAAGAWSVDRSLTGSALPGQVRGATGFSIATGSISFAQPAGTPLSPWGRGALGLGAGGSCTLFASHRGPQASFGLALGNFVIAPIAGSSTSNTITLDLEENSVRLRRPFRLAWEYDPAQPSFDAAMVLRRIAADSGYTKTDIQDTGSRLSGVFDVAGKDSWTVAQEIASATLGAVWISETGVFTYRNRGSLRGGAIVESIEALDSLESLDWVLDPGEIADRVAITYIPTDVTRTLDTTTLWEATEPVRVAGGQTKTLMADIQGTTDRVSKFLNYLDESMPATRFSRWGASTSPAGGGVRPPDGALQITAEMSGPSRAQIHITNTTGAPLWLVDGNGNPSLILRTGFHITPGEPVTTATGASDTASLSELSIDAGPWVQDHETAQSIRTWAAGQTSRAQATISGVRVKPDLARQLGDIVRLTDGHTSLRSKAIITGVHVAGDHAGYTQHLDLALLEPVFADFDIWLAEQGITTFADFDTWLESQGLTTFADFDLWLTDFGGTI